MTVNNERLILSMTRAFLHYAKQGFFIKPNQILNSMAKIENLPGIIIHGRWDIIDLPELAYSLHKALLNSELWMISEGAHNANDPPISSVLAKATDAFTLKFMDSEN